VQRHYPSPEGSARHLFRTKERYTSFSRAALPSELYRISAHWDCQKWIGGLPINHFQNPIVRHSEARTVVGEANAKFRLDEGDLRRIEDAFPHSAVQGERYAPEMMRIINS